ncbi:MAG: DUF4398 domain-containing protein [Candidatus Poribacteria bacterium]
MKLYILLLLMIMLCLAGCGAKTQNFDILLDDATTQIDTAQKAGADQLASAEFNEAKTLLESAKVVPKGKQKISLAQRAYAKALLSEALAKQLSAEKEANRLEAELKIMEEEANKIKSERKAVEEDLKRMIAEQENE